MDISERSRIVSEIVSGVFYVGVFGNTYLVKDASAIQKYISEEIYSQDLQEAASLGIMTEEEIVQKMVEVGLWSEKAEEEFKSIPKTIEDKKMQMYNAYSNFSDYSIIEKSIKKDRTNFFNLSNKRSILRKESAEGYADSRKYRYLILSNITDIQGCPSWKSEDYGRQESVFSESLITACLSKQPKEKEIREISRTEPWRNLWGAGKSEGSLFGIPASQLTTPQKAVIAWSRVYDNIFESQECPSGDVIKHDDLLDGWLIIQSKNREKEKSRHHAEKSSGQKGDELFFMADTQEAARRVYALNDATGRATIRNRRKEIDKVGSKEGIRAQDMLDAKLEMQQMSNEQFKNRAHK